MPLPQCAGWSSSPGVQTLLAAVISTGDDVLALVQDIVGYTCVTATSTQQQATKPGGWRDRWRVSASIHLCCQIDQHVHRLLGSVTPCCQCSAVVLLSFVFTILCWVAANLLAWDHSSGWPRGFRWRAVGADTGTGMPGQEVRRLMYVCRGW